MAAYLVNCKTSEEFPVTYGKGGMKSLLSNAPTNVVSARNIIIDDVYAHVGQGSILRTTLDPY